MSTITVELCGGNRKGIEKQDFDANKPDNENYITINLVPEKYKLSNLKITVGLLNQDWEAIEADKYKLELEWSRVDMFYFSAGTVVKVVDTGDNLYYGYTKIIATNTDICDLLSITVTGAKSGDLHQFVPYVVDDGLIGSSYEPPPFEHFASLIPGEVLWLSYRFRKSPGFDTVTTGYRAPGITGGTITDRQWYRKNVAYIYEVYYEGLTGWFFNSQCTVLNKGQWVFLNTDLATSLENKEDFSIPYGTELDGAKSFILPMMIQGHGPPCDVLSDQSKYYSNIRYAKATINNIDRNLKSAYYICDDLKIKGSCTFYCQGPGIDPESGDQFLIGDNVLLMLGGDVSAGGPYGDITIIGSLDIVGCTEPVVLLNITQSSCKVYIGSSYYSMKSLDDTAPPIVAEVVDICINNGYTICNTCIMVNYGLHCSYGSASYGFKSGGLYTYKEYMSAVVQGTTYNPVEFPITDIFAGYEGPTPTVLLLPDTQIRTYNRFGQELSTTPSVGYASAADKCAHRSNSQALITSFNISHEDWWSWEDHSNCIIGMECARFGVCWESGISGYYWKTPYESEYIAFGASFPSPPGDNPEGGWTTYGISGTCTYIFNPYTMSTPLVGCADCGGLYLACVDLVSPVPSIPSETFTDYLVYRVVPDGTTDLTVLAMGSGQVNVPPTATIMMPSNTPNINLHKTVSKIIGPVADNILNTTVLLHDEFMLFDINTGNASILTYVDNEVSFISGDYAIMDCKFIHQLTWSYDTKYAFYSYKDPLPTSIHRI